SETDKAASRSSCFRRNASLAWTASSIKLNAARRESRISTLAFSSSASRQLRSALVDASFSTPPFRKFGFPEEDVLFTAPDRRFLDIRLLSPFVLLEFERIPSGLAQPEAEFVNFFLQLNHPHLSPDGYAIETGQLLGVRAKFRVTMEQVFLVFLAF